MGRGFAISVLIHAVIFVAAYFGVPFLQDDFPMTDVPMAIEIVNVSDETNVPSKPKVVKPKLVQKEKPKPKPKPAPPPPPPPPVSKPEPAPVKEVSKIVEPAPALIEKPKPKPEPKPAPKKVEAKKRTPAPLPPRKPKPKPKEKPVDAFESVLKTLEDLSQTPPRPPKELAPELDFAKMMESALDKPNQRNDLGAQMTISEIDLVRQQIHKCWNLPAGAKDAHKMRISIRIAMNPDGRVRTARILGRAKMTADPFYRAMAESALRAVNNPRCQPFKLPPNKYDRWKNMLLNFDPKEMFGL